MRVLIAAGGTAGHVFPALALAQRLIAVHGADVMFAGTPGGHEARLVPAAGFAFHPVDATPLRRELSLRAARAPFDAIRSIRTSGPLVKSVDVVVGMGGYASVPVGLAAARARRPLVIHEQNAVPGLANRLLARRARAIALTFAEAGARLPSRVRTIVTGNPVRDSVLSVRTERDALAKEAQVELGLEPDRRTVVVLGGSQGALRLDTAVVEAIARSRDRADLQILLLTGAAHEETIRATIGDTGELHVRVRGFLDRMELAYACADLVVSRAGATTCAEISVCGLPAILVPYPYATGGHQEANARALERAGGAIVSMDGDLSGAVLESSIRALLDDTTRLAAMAEGMRSWSRPEATDALAAVVAEVGGAR